jgi:hypothetical protein
MEKENFMRRQPKTIEIDDMIYWSSGDDLGECDRRSCGESAFSYNEDGQKFCEDHLIEWHDSEDSEMEIEETDFV